MFGLLLLPFAFLLSLFTTDGGGGGNQNDGDSGSQDGQNANAGGQQGGSGDQGNQQGQQNGNQQQGTTFTQEDVNRLVGAARSEGRKAAEDAAKKKADEDAAKAKGEWEKLATDRQSEIDQLKADLAKRDREALIARVAAKHKLPESLSARLVGDDEAALDADAKELAKHLKPATAPDTEGGAGNRASANRPAQGAADKKTQNGARPHYSFIPAGAVTIPD